MKIDHKEVKAMNYCYMNGTKAVYLNRWDQRIKEFENYDLAMDFAKDNLELIDIKITKKKFKEIGVLDLFETDLAKYQKLSKTIGESIVKGIIANFNPEEMVRPILVEDL